MPTWLKFFAYKRAVSQKLSAGIESLFKTAKIDLLRGTALITGSGCVRVTDADGSANATPATTFSLPPAPCRPARRSRGWSLP